MTNRIELWLCQDCMLFEETGDDPTDGDEARLTQCEEGWSALRAQGYVGNDTTDAAQFSCNECGHIQLASDTTHGKDEDGDAVPICNACGSNDGMSVRESGDAEFSWSDCDCCGSSLGGSRHRYALFPRDAEPAVPGGVRPLGDQPVAASPG